MLTRAGLLVAITCLLVALVASPSFSQSAAPNAQSSPQPLRIGVYNSRIVSIAFIRSASRMAALRTQMQDLQREMKEAEAANDTNKIDEIKSRGRNMQTISHMQVFGNAPADDAIEAIKDRLPIIAKEAGVDVIVAKLDFQSPGVQVIDVTDKIAAEYKPTEQTLKVMAAMKNSKPITLLEALSMKE